ncbi:DUF6624 domain-containing protein [Aeromicrobium sp. NPDC092404]|uniref:DUF6624 domain-containing protein n=1 Tax=Aeromicrobium sp. NPDC092404 TaxID=3154976 RepID=UPI00341EDEE4
MHKLTILLAGLLLALTACGGSETRDKPVQKFDQALHDELIAMFERDQLDRLGGKPSNESDQDRTDRLEEIIDEHGWPTIALVGKDGEDAAWTIAQHSDLDKPFQAKALKLLRKAVADKQASPGNLAYLEDRVAVGSGKPQLYGTQMGCGPDGPEPATPIKDEDGVEERRKKAGLEPLADYVTEMTAVCAEDEAS